MLDQAGFGHRAGTQGLGAYDHLGEVVPLPYQPDEALETPPPLDAEQLEEIECLRQRVAVLESWVDASSTARKVEFIQSQRLRLMKAAERDWRWSFVVSLPLVLAAVYCLGVGVLIWFLLGG
jgi:hypothetical protein